MPTNKTGTVMRALVARYPGLVGQLHTPTRWSPPLAPYALDNGAFGAWRKKQPFDEVAFLKLLVRARRCGQAPQWVLVPDVVTDKTGTLRAWRFWNGWLRHVYGWPLAFAVQDGMTKRHVPSDAEVVFIGGSTEWKRGKIEYFCDRFPRVHVGRINTYRWVWHSAQAGAVSCDGTGWFRGDPLQTAGLYRFLSEWESGQREISPNTTAMGQDINPRRRATHT